MNGMVDWDTYTEERVALRGATASDHKLLKSLARGRVLDVGCGTGLHLSRLVGSNLSRAIGVDMGIPGLLHGKAQSSSDSFVAGNLCQLPFRNN